MRTLAVLVVAPVVLACAAHNSHRVPIDLNADLAPLIEEAWSSMEAAWNAPIPIRGLPVDVRVEPVVVQWLPFSPEVPPGGQTLSQEELRAYIVDAVSAPPAPGDVPPRTVHLELLADLHDPDALVIQVRCVLRDALAPRSGLAGGASSCLVFERLYCHGCRERWGSDGTRLHPEPDPGDGHVHGELGLGVGFGFPIWSGDSSPGYIKR